MPVTTRTVGMQIPEFHSHEAKDIKKDIKAGKFGDKGVTRIHFGPVAKPEYMVAARVLGDKGKLGMQEEMTCVVVPLKEADAKKPTRVAINIESFAKRMYGEDKEFEKEKKDFKTNARQLRGAETHLKKMREAQDVAQKKFDKVFDRVLQKMGDLNDKDTEALLQNPKTFKADPSKLKYVNELGQAKIELDNTREAHSGAIKRYDDACTLLQKQMAAIVQTRIGIPQAKPQAATGASAAIPRPPSTPKPSLATRVRDATPPTTPKPPETPQTSSTSQVATPPLARRPSVATGQVSAPPITAKPAPTVDFSKPEAVRAEMKKILDTLPQISKEKRAEFRELEKPSNNPYIRGLVGTLIQGHSGIIQRAKENEKNLEKALTQEPVDEAKIKKAFEKLQNGVKADVAGFEKWERQLDLTEAAAQMSAFAAALTKEDEAALAPLGGKPTDQQLEKAKSVLQRLLGKLPNTPQVAKDILNTRGVKAGALIMVLLLLTRGGYGMIRDSGVSQQDLFSHIPSYLNKFADMAGSVIGGVYQGAQSLRGMLGNEKIQEGVAAGLEYTPEALEAEAMGTAANAMLESAQSWGGTIAKVLKENAGNAAIGLAYLRNALPALPEFQDFQVPDFRGALSRTSDAVRSGFGAYSGEATQEQIDRLLEEQEPQIDTGVPEQPRVPTGRVVKTASPTPGKGGGGQPTGGGQGVSGRAPTPSPAPSTGNVREELVDISGSKGHGIYDLEVAQQVLEESKVSLEELSGKALETAIAGVETVFKSVSGELPGLLSRWKGLHMQSGSTSTVDLSDYPQIAQLAALTPDISVKDFIAGISGALNKLGDALPEGSNPAQIKQNVLKLLNEAAQDPRIQPHLGGAIPGTLVFVTLLITAGLSVRAQRKGEQAQGQQLQTKWNDLLTKFRVEGRRSELHDLLAQSRLMPTMALDKVIEQNRAWLHEVDTAEGTINLSIKNKDFEQAGKDLENIQRFLEASRKPAGGKKEPAEEKKEPVAAKGASPARGASSGLPPQVQLRTLLERLPLADIDQTVQDLQNEERNTDDPGVREAAKQYRTHLTWIRGEIAGYDDKIKDNLSKGKEGDVQKDLQAFGAFLDTKVGTRAAGNVARSLQHYEQRLEAARQKATAAAVSHKADAEARAEDVAALALQEKKLITLKANRDKLGADTKAKIIDRAKKLIDDQEQVIKKLKKKLGIV